LVPPVALSGTLWWLVTAAGAAAHSAIGGRVGVTVPAPENEKTFDT